MLDLKLKNNHKFSRPVMSSGEKRKRKIFTLRSRRILILRSDVWVRWNELKYSLKMSCNSELATALIDSWHDRAKNTGQYFDEQQTYSALTGGKLRQVYTEIDSSISSAVTKMEDDLDEVTVKVELSTGASSGNFDSETVSDREMNEIINFAKNDVKLIKLAELESENSKKNRKQRKSTRVRSRGYRPNYAYMDWKEQSDSDSDSLENLENLMLNKSKPDNNKKTIDQSIKAEHKVSRNKNKLGSDSGFIDEKWAVWGDNSSITTQKCKKVKKNTADDPDFVVSDGDIQDVDVNNICEYTSDDDKMAEKTESDKVVQPLPNEKTMSTPKYTRKRKQKINSERAGVSVSVESLGISIKIPKQEKKIKREKNNEAENIKKPWVKIKLEDYQEKYRIEIVGSFERKNRNSNLTEELYTCLLCGRFKSTAKDIFEEHIEKHVNMVLECDHCSYVGRSEVELVRHKVGSGHMPKGQEYMCDICGMVLYTWDARLSHMGKAHNDPKFKCKFCDEKFVTRSKRKQHARLVHIDLAQYCKSCKADCQALSAEDFMKHQETCKPGHQCQVCGVVLASKNGLSSHLKSTHMGVRKYQCDMCPYAGKSGQRLREHVMTHTSIHPYSCGQCTFTCVQACQLKSHMRTHSGEKPFKCTQCQFAAAWNVQLKEHIKLHDMQTSVICKRCRIVFKNEKARKMHEKKDHCF